MSDARSNTSLRIKNFVESYLDDELATREHRILRLAKPIAFILIDTLEVSRVVVTGEEAKDMYNGQDTTQWQIDLQSPLAADKTILSIVSDSAFMEGDILSHDFNTRLQTTDGHLSQMIDQLEELQAAGQIRPVS